jgi:hypothetical protein
MDTTSEHESPPRATSALQERTFICSVVFVRLPEYSRRPVVEQARIRERLNAAIGSALRELAPEQRIVLDAGDGMAIGFLGPAEDALLAAAEVRDALSAGEGEAIPVRAGINYGPIKLVKDEGGRPRVVGDGISVAQRIADFAESGQIFASHSFYEVVSCLSEQYGQLFHYQGARTDPDVREHQVYALDRPAAGVRDSAGATGRFRSLKAREALEAQIRGMKSTSPNAATVRLNRNTVLLASLGAALILGTGVAIRASKPGATPATAAKPRQGPITVEPRASVAQPTAPVPKVDAPEPRGSVPQPTAAVPKVVMPEPVAIPQVTPPRAPSSEPARAVVSLAISPWGEVYLNGEYQGVSPPLDRLQLPPGRHEIQIRNQASRPHVRVVRIRGQERLRIKYKFR